MSATKVEVGRVYKRGDSEVYIICIKEKRVLKKYAGRDFDKIIPEEIYAVILDKPYDRAKIKVGRLSIGEEVQKPINKSEWGIKVLYSILYNECRFMYDQSRRTGFCKASTRGHIENLLEEVSNRCYNKTRNLKNYKKLLDKKNSLCRLVVKKKSNSRGALQRSKRFDRDVPIKLPCCVESPKPASEEIESLNNVVNRFRHDRNSRNHMNLTLSEFNSMGLLKRLYNVPTDFPHSMYDLSRNESLTYVQKEWLGILEISSYDLKKEGGQEYFPNARVKDGKNYIKPYGWPEIYKGRIQTKEETKALRGCKNKKGLTYPQWLSVSPSYLTSLCGHYVHYVAVDDLNNILNCQECAVKRYKAWLK